MKKILTAVVFSVCTLATAQAAQEVTYDAGGMPYCVSDQGSPYYARFTWSHDPFQRDVFIEFHNRDAEKQLNQSFDYLCTGERQYTAVSDAHAEAGKLTLLSDSSNSIQFNDKSQHNSVLTVSITDDMKFKFAQVRKGASEALDAELVDPKNYFAKNPVSNFTLEMNKDLTHRFGAGFAIEIYRQSVESKPKNAEFKKSILASIAEDPSALADKDKRLSKYVALFVMGFGHTLGGNDRYDPMIADMRSLGLETRVAYTQPYGRTPENAEALYYQIYNLIQEGREVLLFSASNGSLQTLAGLALFMERQQKGLLQAPGAGHIRAFVTLSGVMYGAFAADFATNFPQWLMIKRSLSKGLQAQGISLDAFDNLDSFKDLRTDFVSAYAEKYQKDLPRDIPYINLIGTPRGTGLVKDPAMGLLQTQIIRPLLNNYGANDGYIEFPGTETPVAWGLNSYQAVVNASHAIMDGEYEGNDLTQPGPRHQMIAALLNVVGDLVEQSH